MSTPHLCNTTLLICSCGLEPSPLLVLPINTTSTSGQNAANIMDHVPFVNIQPFGLCNSPANPMVASATAAAMGTLTPMPCIPATPLPWTPGVPTVLLGGEPTIDMTCQLNCMWAGIITPMTPGQMTEIIP